MPIEAGNGEEVGGSHKFAGGRCLGSTHSSSRYFPNQVLLISVSEMIH